MNLQITQNLKLLLSVVVIFLVSGECVEARVFEFGNESFAPFVSVVAGTPNLKYRPIHWQSTNGHSGDSYDFMYGGEFGFLWKTQGAGIRLGALVHSLDPVSGGTGKNLSGETLYTVDGEGRGFGGFADLVVSLGRTPQAQWNVILGGGLLYSKLTQTYSMTTVGETQLGTTGLVTEVYRAQIPFLRLAVGSEYWLTQTSTISLSLGYHHALKQGWNYGNNSTHWAGPWTDGSEVRYEDGETKKMDWSYLFLKVDIAFYVKTLR